MGAHPPQRRALPARLIRALAAAALLLPPPAPARAPPAPAAAECPRIGPHPSGPLDAITDVAGVRVGQVTVDDGAAVHTGVTAILPHGGNLFRSRVPAGFVVANGFGKFAGATQVAELGELETPVLLTNTLSVPEAMAASVEWTLAQPGNEDVRSVNAVVGETNDGGLSDIRGRHVTVADARRAIAFAREGAVAQGSVGAGRGTIAFGWKGGIGTASRRVSAGGAAWTVGVLVQANYGGRLTVAGTPIPFAPPLTSQEAAKPSADGSVVIVIATDAPLSDRNLRRLAARAFAGIARTGSTFSDGSGDYALAFSTHPDMRRPRAGSGTAEIANAQMTPLFEAAADATEASVLHALFAANTVRGERRTAHAIDAARVRTLLRCPR